MVRQAELLGLLYLENRLTTGAFTPQRLDVLRVLAAQAAISLENARLYSNLRHENAERRRAEARIMAALAEKELLLGEIHHRVKNNLQVISSLFSLQADGVGDPTARALLRASESRVRAMALIHERLYRFNDLEAIDFAGVCPPSNRRSIRPMARMPTRSPAMSRRSMCPWASTPRSPAA